MIPNDAIFPMGRVKLILYIIQKNTSCSGKNTDNIKRAIGAMTLAENRITRVLSTKPPINVQPPALINFFYNRRVDLLYLVVETLVFCNPIHMAMIAFEL